MWPDIAVLEDSLSQLQEVDIELAATSGGRSRGLARAFHLPEVYLARASASEDLQKSWYIRKF